MNAPRSSRVNALLMTTRAGPRNALAAASRRRSRPPGSKSVSADASTNARALGTLRESTTTSPTSACSPRSPSATKKAGRSERSASSASVSRARRYPASRSTGPRMVSARDRYRQARCALDCRKASNNASTRSRHERSSAAVLLVGLGFGNRRAAAQTKFGRAAAISPLAIARAVNSRIGRAAMRAAPPANRRVAARGACKGRCREPMISCSRATRSSCTRAICWRRAYRAE